MHSCFLRGGIFIGNSVGDVNGKIWLDDLKCKGSEGKLAECRRKYWGSHYCHHSEDVGIRCDNFDRESNGNYKYDIVHNLFCPHKYVHLNHRSKRNAFVLFLPKRKL